MQQLQTTADVHTLKTFIMQNESFVALITADVSCDEWRSSKLTETHPVIRPSLQTLTLLFNHKTKQRF